MGNFTAQDGATTFLNGVRVALNSYPLPHGEGVSLSPVYWFEDKPEPTKGDRVAPSTRILEQIISGGANTYTFPYVLSRSDRFFDVPGVLLSESRVLSIVFDRPLISTESVIVNYAGLDSLGRPVEGQTAEFKTNGSAKVYVFNKSLRLVTKVSTRVIISDSGAHSPLYASIGISNLIAFPFVVPSGDCIQNVALNGSTSTGTQNVTIDLSDIASQLVSLPVAGDPWTGGSAPGISGSIQSTGSSSFTLTLENVLTSFSKPVNWDKGYPQNTSTFVSGAPIGYASFTFMVVNSTQADLIYQTAEVPDLTSRDTFGLYAFQAMDSLTGNAAGDITSFSMDVLCYGQSSFLNTRLNDSYPVYLESMKKIALGMGGVGEKTVPTDHAQAFGINCLYGGLSGLSEVETCGIQYGSKGNI